MPLWPVFHGPVILPYDSKTIWWMSVIFSDNETGDPNFDLKINIGQHDIFYGLVILLNVLKIIWWKNSIVGVMDQCDTQIDLIKHM